MGYRYLKKILVRTTEGGGIVFRFILGVGVCAFPHVLGMKESKKIAAP